MSGAGEIGREANSIVMLMCLFGRKAYDAGPRPGARGDVPRTRVCKA